MSSRYDFFSYIVVILVFCLILLIVIGGYRKSKFLEQSSRMAHTTTSSNTPLSKTGQYVEVVSTEELMTWFFEHKNDRKVIALTGVGNGAYGNDDSFILISEPVWYSGGRGK